MRRILPVLLTIAVSSVFAGEAEAPQLPGLHYYYPVPAANPPQVIEADLIAYGGSPGSVTACVQIQRMGKKAAMFCFGKHAGGLTSGGLSATDVGNRGAIGGMANEFYDRVGKLRGFKPSDAEKTFRAMLEDAKVPVYYEHRLKSITKDGNRIVEIEFENGNKARGKIFVDATYEGDLFAKAGVGFHVGREANSQYGETINGVQFHNKHNFDAKVDPYKVEGDPKSGLLWGIYDGDAGKSGQADKKLQAYNFRMFLTNSPERLAWPKPAGYDPSRYALYARYVKLKPQLPSQLHNGDCNNQGGFSTDYIGGNWNWPDADYATREKIFQDHVNYQTGLMYFAANDPSVPEDIRTKTKAFGLHPGEFKEFGGWPHQLYIREGRRMISDLVMTERHCSSKEVVEDSVGMGSYTMDSHNCQRVVVNGFVRNEGDVQIGCPKPYPISYRSIVPKEAECANLFVPVCLSSSHIAYGSIRMEPVFMILGQSAGTAAAMAIDANISVQKVDYAKLKERLLADKQILVWTAPEKPPVKKK